jgi:hypothetical protein
MKPPLLSLGAMVLAVGCGNATSSWSSSDAIVDEPAVMAMSAAYEGLAKANASSFRSAVGQVPHLADPDVDVYVSPSALELYRSVDPASSDVRGPFSEGTLIVKDNLAEPPFLTVMYKARAGYDADHGDWWYGRLTREGSSTGFTGRVGFCIDCHGRRANQDYVYGVPADHR